MDTTQPDHGRRYDLAKHTMTMAKAQYATLADVPADLIEAARVLLDPASAVAEPDAAELLALDYTDGGPAKWAHADGSPTKAAMDWASDASEHDED